MPESLRNAVADAIEKAETCSVTTRTLGTVSAWADLTAARDANQIVPGRLQPDCTGRTAALVDSIPGTTIYVCPFFFELPTASEMSLTIMHEGLHLRGVQHSDFDRGSAGMDAAIRSACGY